MKTVFKINEAKYTQGPWKAHFNVPTAIIEGHIIKQDDEIGCPIVNLWVGGGTHGKSKQLANAKLIAAAPELLELLQRFIDITASVKGIDITRNKAIKLIKKATE